MKIKRIIKVEVPKEIWDTDMSIWNVLFMRKRHNGCMDEKYC